MKILNVRFFAVSTAAKSSMTRSQSKLYFLKMIN